jgi:dipeptidyl aminopeptidase/acylaminoacyl peptidase
MRDLRLTLVLITVLAGLTLDASAQARRLESGDYLKLRSVTAVDLSPDGTRVACVVERYDRPGRPLEQLWIMPTAGGNPVRVLGDADAAARPRWSPDGRWLAFEGTSSDRAGLWVARADGTGARFLAGMAGTNSPLTHEGDRIAWAPDSSRIAFVSAAPGPETELASGDPVVITRYLYKPDYSEGNTRFNDNRRRHIFIVNQNGGNATQMTRGTFEEHSIDWSPDGREIAFISNREPDWDFVYNPDIFALRVDDGSIRRLTATESAEFMPRWSPDGKSIAFMGTKRGLTDLETDMEDTHLWVMSADGSGRREIGAAIDNRQYVPRWSPDGSAVYCLVPERGSVVLYRVPVNAAAPQAVVKERGRVEAYALGRDGRVAYSYTGPRDLAQLYIREASTTAHKLTDLNADVLGGIELAEVEPLTFVSNDFRFEIEAFLTRPVGMTPDSRHPVIVMIHGGPHWFQGPAFHFHSQAYAARGWATLQVNYRGSTGYGQRFADAVFRDQNGDEGMDVLYGVSAAVRRNLWIDRERMGIEGTSYGGQLSAWLVTQTPIFKAAIPTAGITNLVSYNYMTYYNQYEEMEWGARPHQGNLMEALWERSALKHVAKVKTPTMLVHGENDNDVPIAESEQFYIALKDVGVETVFVRYPREGHGLRESRHIVDFIDRSARWYETHFRIAPKTP